MPQIHHSASEETTNIGGNQETEILFLIHLADTEHFLRAQELGFTAEDFSFFPQVFQFIQSHFRASSRIPTKEAIIALFGTTGFSLETLDTVDFSFALEAMLKRATYTRLYKLLEQDLQRLAEYPQETLSHLIQELPRIPLGRPTGFEYTDADAVARFDRYRAREQQANGLGIVGIKTGIPVFDKKRRGWEAGEMCGIIARPHVGKSWLLIHSACTAYAAGKRVLFVSPEMSREQVGIRVDALMFKRMRQQALRTGDIHAGLLNQQVSQMYHDYLQELSAERRWVTFDGSSDRGISIAAIDSWILAHNPDVVFIDGLLLLQADGRAQAWEKVLEISYGLKNLAEHRALPMIYVAQANRSSRDDRGMPNIPTLAEIAYGDSVGQASDRIVGMGPSSVSSKERMLIVQKFRTEEFNPLPIHITFDPNEGDLGTYVDHQIGETDEF